MLRENSSPLGKRGSATEADASRRYSLLWRHALRAVRGARAFAGIPPHFVRSQAHDAGVTAGDESLNTTAGGESLGNGFNSLAQGL